MAGRLSGIHSKMGKGNSILDQEGLTCAIGCFKKDIDLTRDGLDKTKGKRPI